MKTKLQTLGFTSGHVHLLLVAFALFGILIMAKTDINVKALFAKADDEQHMLTFEEVRAQALAVNSSTTDTTASDAEAEQQMALLDRSLDQGQVLGDDIGIGAIPSAEDLYSDDVLNTIPIQSVVPTSAKSVEEYSNRLAFIQNYYNTTEMFANLNGSSSELINKTIADTENVIASMDKIPVPSELVKYHRYKVLYYRTLASIGRAFNGGEEDLGESSRTLFSLMNEMTNVENWVNKEYKITL